MNDPEIGCAVKHTDGLGNPAPCPDVPRRALALSTMPSIEIRRVTVLDLPRSSAPAERQVLAGDSESRLLINGREVAVSSAHPVVIESHGLGTEGGLVTLTLIADSVTIDGKEVGDV